MNPFFAWLIKSSVSLALLYILFRLAMHNDKTHSLNRFLLLAILLVSAVIPFLDFQFFYEEVPLKHVEVFREFVSTPVSVPDVAMSQVSQVQTESSASFNPFLIFYISAVLVLLIRLFVAVIRVMQIIGQAEKRKLSKIVLAIVKDLIQPFSFFNKIILSEKDFTDNKDIVVAHEYAHIKQLHAIDLVICELFTVLHFFNPFMWLLRRDLKLIHEYQADQAVLNKGIDATKYQLLVLQKSVGERRFAMANHFTQKPILKRIKMMQKKNKKQCAWVKIVFFVPVLILLLQAFARPELITKADEIIPIASQQNQNEKWLEKWTIENIGNGFFQPELKVIDALRKPNNVLVVLMNRRNELLIENKYAKKEDVKRIVKEFLNGKNPDGKIGSDFSDIDIPLIGKSKVSNGSISFQHDLATSKSEINLIFKSIGLAFLEERKEKAQILFGEDYFSIDEQKREAVDMAVPIWFSIESPKISKNSLSPTPPTTFLVSLYNDKIIFQNKEIVITEISQKVSEFISKHGKDAVVSVKIENNINADRIHQLKEELRKAGALNVNVKTMN